MSARANSPPNVRATKVMDETPNAIREVEVSYLRTDTGQRELKRDWVTMEEPFHLIVNGEHYATILSIPIQRKELAVGYLITEGIVQNIAEIREMRLEAQTCNVTLSPDINIQERIQLATPFRRVIFSACSTPGEWPLYRLIDRLKIPKVSFGTVVNAKTIAETTRHFSTDALIHSKTGGTHAAALYRADGTCIAFSEDVGRHNAVDKAIGVALIGKSSLEESFLTSTGRITGDIALKAARVKIPIVASIAAAVDSGIEIAKLTDLTLIGFVRGSRMNIYTHPERIV